MSKLSIQTGDLVSFIKDGKRRIGFVVDIQSSLISLKVERKDSLLSMFMSAGGLDLSVNIGETDVGLPLTSVPEVTKVKLNHGANTVCDYVRAVNAAIADDKLVLTRCML